MSNAALQRLDEQIEAARNCKVSSGLTVEEWRQVFADAKAVRDTALANAKQAMEAAFARYEQGI